MPYHVDATGTLLVFIAHMGGPFWEHRDEGAWSIIKGQFAPAEENPRDAARREFAEEVGMPAPDGELVALGEQRQQRGRIVMPFALHLDDPAQLRFVESNLFEMEWPRGSGRIASFPEMDAAEWLPVDVARRKILQSQTPILDALETLVATAG